MMTGNPEQSHPTIITRAATYLPLIARWVTRYSHLYSMAS